jgi:23S rRNA (adenine2503-C2)-methyltransferase
MSEQFSEKYNLPRYRIAQFNKAYYQEYIDSWDGLTTWPKDLRDSLKKDLPFCQLELIKLEVSKDLSTQKALFQTVKGNYIESVLMTEKDRNTVCVSCMSGCPVGCLFCATGQMGLNESLNSGQIVDQVLFFSRLLKKENLKITNIVYMGMGEPMLNLRPVSHSIEILTGADKFGLSRRHITLSTCGYIDELKEFMELDLGVKIAISLHAPNQELREKLMPTVSKENPLDKLFPLLDEFVERTNKRITYEYVLLDGINDSDQQAKELADLLYSRLVLVNLIDYNSNPYRSFKKSPNTKHFMDILLNNGINTTLRKSYGNDISGACGQLAKAT